MDEPAKAPCAYDFGKAEIISRCHDTRACAMKTALIHFCLVSILILSPGAYAARLHHMPITSHAEGEHAQSPAEAQTTKKIKNQFFSVSLPDGWTGQTTKNVAPSGANVVFKKGKMIAVTLTMTKTAMGIGQTAATTAEKMRKRGMDVSDPVKNDGFYTINISKKGVNGRGWFGRNGGITAITIIIAPRPEDAGELLKEIKPILPGLVPQSVQYKNIPDGLPRWWEKQVSRWRGTGRLFGVISPGRIQARASLRRKSQYHYSRQSLISVQICSTFCSPSIIQWQASS